MISPMPQDLVPRAEVLPVTEVRSTLLTSSMGALREMGLFDRYVGALPHGWAEKLLPLATGVWLPIEYAEVHYTASDSLALPTHTILELGRSVGRLTEKTILGLLLRAATGAGASPATVLASTPRFWSRCFTGGGVAARLTGPKDAVFESHGISLVRYRQFRTGYRALLTQVLAPFCTKVYMRELPEPTSTTSIRFEVSWA